MSTGDTLAQLPVDETPPTNNEVQVVETLFKKHPKEMNSLFNELKDPALVAILVIAISLKQVEDLIKRFIPPADKSPYLLVLIKGLIVAVLYWLIKHFYLSRGKA